MNIVCIIPARGGSKGIINKNIINFNGKPLLEWSILQAKNSKYITEIYISSDSSDILKIAKDNKVNFIQRPDEISGDEASSESALVHALNLIESYSNVDLVVFLQATSPLRKLDDIDNAIQLMIDHDYDSLFSGIKYDDCLLWTNRSLDIQDVLIPHYDVYDRRRRQDEEDSTYLENGSIYIFKPEILKEGSRLGGDIGIYEMEKYQQFEIDEESDIEICEYFMKKII